MPICVKCGWKHEGRYLMGSNARFGCGNMDKNVRDSPPVTKNEGDGHGQSQPNPLSGPSKSQKKNIFLPFKLGVNKRILPIWLPAC